MGGKTGGSKKALLGRNVTRGWSNVRAEWGIDSGGGGEGQQPRQGKKVAELRSEPGETKRRWQQINEKRERNKQTPWSPKKRTGKKRKSPEKKLRTGRDPLAERKEKPVKISQKPTRRYRTGGRNNAKPNHRS